ncbi:hypothetical protein A3863_10375 [Priestia endophytica]|uniref:hypothetical protein n=1 Tax=Priestia endophytica TaxID=135735 RepID=UPI000DCA3DF0|nr:hypothetical protein [Priestia endophytica]RAS89616.1 hypothetical protein A3863_10375 [Priestia endophytica]
MSSLSDLARRARREAEAVARRLEEERKRLEEETRRAMEEAARKVTEEAEAAARALKEQANRVIIDQVNNAINSFSQNISSEITNLSETGKQLVNKIEEAKEELEKLQELFDLNKLKQKILEKAEELSEEYLKSKLTAFDQLKLSAVPDVELELDNSSLKVDLYIYLLPLEYKGQTPQTDSFVTIESHLVQSITVLKVPDVNAKLKFNQENVENDIKERIESEKDKLIQAFFATFFSEYVAVFNQLKKYLPELG